ncbi:MAG: DUF4238 domain-containing protein [Moorellales bacterium]
MVGRTQKHHYLPRFYLAGFTEKGTREVRLWALDQEGLVQYKARRERVAFEKDYNRLLEWSNKY